MPRLLEELKRRKVLHTLGLYLVGAWICLQVAGVVAEIWSAPNWALQALFLVLIAGVPFAVVTSWFYDVTRAPGRDSGAVIGGWRGWARLGAWAVATVVVAAVAIAYLWPDEYPSDDVRRLLALTHERSNDPRGFEYGLYGFNAPAGRDIWEYGNFLVTTYNSTGQWLGDIEPPLEFTFSSTDLCPLRDDDCITGVMSELAGVRTLAAANAELMVRYDQLRSSREFGMVIRGGFEAPLPAYRNLVLAAGLRQRLALLLVEEGNADMAFALLDAEVEFHRRILRGSSWLVQKMVAGHMLEEDLRAYVLMAARAAAAGGATMIGPAPARLSLTEASLVAPMRHEASSVFDFITLPRATYARDMAATRDGGSSPMLFTAHRILPLKRYRTANRVGRLIMDVARLSTLSAGEVLQRYENDVPDSMSLLEWYVNTSGAMGLGNMFPDYVWYQVRVHHYDAQLVLARVARGLLTDGATAASVHGHLLALPGELRNPFDGRPPVWRDGVLQFEKVIDGPPSQRPLQARFVLPLP